MKKSFLGVSAHCDQNQEYFLTPKNDKLPTGAIYFDLYSYALNLAGSSLLQDKHIN